MPKIVRIIGRLNVGGPGIHVLQLAHHLRPEYETVLVSGIESPHEANMLREAERLEVPVVRIPELGREINVTSDAVSVVKLVRLIRREHPDIVHTHTAKAGFVGRLAARLCGVPVVLHTFHGHVFRGYFGPIKTQFFIQLERLLAHMTDEILTVNEEQRQELVNEFSIATADTIRAMLLGLPLEPLISDLPSPAIMRKAWGLTVDQSVVGIVARLVSVKGHELFLDMAAALQRRRPHTQFVVLGHGERRQELAAYARAVGASVTFATYEPPDVPAVYAALDVVCLTSFNEGSPVALIEAMAAGKPVVSTAVGGVADVVEHGKNGFLVYDRNLATFLGYVERLLDDPGLAAAMGAHGRADTYPRYDISRLADELRKLYAELLARRLSATR